MKKFFRNALSLGLVLALALTAAGCSNADKGGETGSTEGEVSEQAPALEAEEGEKIVNVGVTDSLGGVNPFVMDQTEINKYAVGLMFLPLVELDKDLNFQYMLCLLYTSPSPRD